MLNNLFVWIQLILSITSQNNVNSNDSCITNPSSSKCAEYELPKSTIDSKLESLCRQMPNMPGCTIRSQCEDGNSFSTPTKDTICSPFSILADVCAKDMPKMSDCSVYTEMCSSDSVVKQCTKYKPIENLPTTQQATKLIQGICSDMEMPGCKKCVESPGKCDLLLVYTDLCKSMPDMKQCSSFGKLCQEVGESSQLCKAQSKEGYLTPIMRMYFHTGLADYILFKSWVPQSGGSYFGSFIAIVLIGIFYEFLIILRSRFEKNWSERSSPILCKYSTLQFRIDTLRAALRFIEVVISYSLMLIAMTFNVGLFIAVILGMSLGTFMFSRFSCHNGDLKPGCGC